MHSVQFMMLWHQFIKNRAALRNQAALYFFAWVWYNKNTNIIFKEVYYV